jgi:predicted ATPase
LDEPETALHPKAIRLYVEMIIRIAQAGVQVFMSTHDYFVINQLSISARRENTSICCFSLSKNADGYVDNQVSDLRQGMPSNPIVDEALNMFDDEIKLELGL